ncbi:MAG: S1-like domain-containing RNA-binding protein [Chitinivibrionia bacterium]|nr:S1-like domain-containing RNA-binding protein [Chitinivibrionia bacterium]
MEIGNYNELTVARILEKGAYLEDDEENEVLFPGTYFPENINIGDKIRVFVYCDSLDRPVATTETPFATVNQFAALKVKDVNNIGAFLDWGILKDLFVPHSQMLGAMRVGETVVVRILFDDKSNRLLATPRLRPFLKKPNAANYENGKKLDCIVCEIRDYGVFVIAEGDVSAMIQISEFRKLPKVGDKFSAFVRELRLDGKLTLTLTPVGIARGEFRDAIYEKLVAAGGFLPFNDNSSPKEIFDKFGLSKKSFKKLIGNLLKLKKIRMDEKGIYQSEQK